MFSFQTVVILTASGLPASGSTLQSLSALHTVPCFRLVWGSYSLSQNGKVCEGRRTPVLHPLQNKAHC